MHCLKRDLPMTKYAGELQKSLHRTDKNVYIPVIKGVQICISVPVYYVSFNASHIHEIKMTQIKVISDTQRRMRCPFFPYQFSAFIGIWETV